MGKRIISVLLIVGICLSVTACSPVENLFDIMNWITDNDNPLSGKSTDERIIMSLNRYGWLQAHPAHGGRFHHRYPSFNFVLFPRQVAYL